MANYTLEEEKELNKELKRWKEKLSKYILSDKWDIIAEQLTELEMGQIQVITNANTHKDVNWLVWGNIDRVIDTIQDMYAKPMCFQGRLKGNRCGGERRKDGYLTSKCRKCKWSIYE